MLQIVVAFIISFPAFISFAYLITFHRLDLHEGMSASVMSTNDVTKSEM